MESWREELYHHGILGMQWGKRNGPPYPLGSSDHSASEKKAGWKKSLNNSSEDKSDRKKFQLTDSQKRAIKIGAAVAVTALAAYGGYKLATNPSVRTLVSKGIQVVKDRPVGDIQRVHSSAKDVISDKSFKSAAEQGYKTVSDLPDLPKDKIPKGVGDAINTLNDDNPLKKPKDMEEICSNTVLAFEGRCRGKDVVPGFQLNEKGKFTGIKAHEVFNCFKDKVDSNGNSAFKERSAKDFDSLKKVKETLSAYPDGSRGYFSSTFKNPFNPQKTYVHSVMWSKSNGKITIGDGINGLKTNWYFRNIDTNAKAYYFRMDNLEFDDEKYLGRVKANI